MSRENSIAEFPAMTDVQRLERLTPRKGVLRMVLDTDAYNEIDDQFAIAHALLSPERLKVEALYAAPFHNARSSSPADGMEKSHAEITRILAMLEHGPASLVHHGATEFLPSHQPPTPTEATRDLIGRARTMPAGEPLYVAAIGAATNVAAAILLAPDIIGRIVVVWLGGHALHWAGTHEFNLYQDMPAARVLFDSGVPLVRIPVMGVASHLQTTVPELDASIRDRSPLGSYLAEIFAAHHDHHFAWAKVIWDIAVTAWLVTPDWVPTHLLHSPIVTDQETWSLDASRHLMRSAYTVDRNAIFADLFDKLNHSGSRS